MEIEFDADARVASEKQYKTLTLDEWNIKADADDEAPSISGYVSIFGNKDSYGDIVHKGAFSKNLKKGGGKRPLLVDHNPSFNGTVGIAELEEDDKGLKFKGYINEDVQAGRDLMAHLRFAKKRKMKIGTSFGYFISKSDPLDEQNPWNGLNLRELEVFEATITQFPANPKAGVSMPSVKSTEVLIKQFLANPDAVKALRDGLLKCGGCGGCSGSCGGCGCGDEPKKEEEKQDVVDSVSLSDLEALRAKLNESHTIWRETA